jgi:manganese transport protein
MSNLIALLLQSHSARLGVVRRLDLAQASRETYSKLVNFILYVLAEIAIVACDLAEVLGMALGLQLLFGLPLIYGVIITMLDTILLIFLINKGMRMLEAFVIALIAIIGISFVIEIFFAKPDMMEMAKGFIPSMPNNTALYIAIGIIGATVMPHNLYLHSALVQTRKFNRDKKSLKETIKFNFIDSAVALNLAFFVNAAILVLAASTFFRSGMHSVSEIKDAHQFLEPILGSKLAPILFAVALIAAGQSSTITGTLAGQIIMEGYINLRIQPWIRRLITRLFAVVPASFFIIVMGEESLNSLLVFSQVVLSLQLGFAVIPLIHFVSDKKKMLGLHINIPTKILSWISVILIVGLNGQLVYSEVSGWLATAEHPIYLWLTVVPISFGAAFLLIFITAKPIFTQIEARKVLAPHTKLSKIQLRPVDSYKKVAIAIDFSFIDQQIINAAVSLGGKEAEYYILHIVETVGSYIMGNQIMDSETIEDKETLEEYAKQLKLLGYNTKTKMGFGKPRKQIPQLVSELNADILIMGSHGHGFFADLILGTTIDAVRHRLSVPVLVVSAK